MISRPSELEALEAHCAAKAGGPYAWTRAVEGERAGEWHHLCPLCGDTLTLTAPGNGPAELTCRAPAPCDPERVRDVLRIVHADVQAGAALNGRGRVADVAVEAPPLPSFPVEALPSVLAEWVRATAGATQTPLDLAAGMALASLSTAALGTATVRCAPGWEEELALWIVCVLPSGERKSAVLRSALEAVREFERERVEEARPAVAREDARREALESRRKDLVRKVGAGKADPSELADVAVRLDAAGEQVLPRMLADDATPEALGGLLARHGSIGVIAAESALLDNLAGRYADGRANLHLACQAYSGEPTRIDRRGRDPEQLERPLLALGLCVQPHVLTRIAAEETMREQGFLARGVFLLPSSNVGARDTDPPPVPSPVAAGYRECVRRVAALRQTDTTDTTGHGGSSVGSVARSHEVTLRFSDDAARRFATMRAAHEPRLAPGYGDLAPVATWANRHPGRVARLAGLLHLAEHPPGRAIDAHTFAAAERIGEHLISHALAALAGDAQRQALERGVAWLDHQEKPTVTLRDLHRGPAGGGHGNVEQARRLADLLEQIGRLRRRPDPDPEPTGGRPPSATYDVLPPPPNAAKSEPA